MRISQAALDRENRAVQPGRERLVNPFVPHELGMNPPVARSPDNILAMDQEWVGTSSWSFDSLNAFKSAYLEGQMFLGYPTLAAMSQRAEYLTPIETIADDMTRNFIELKASAHLGKSEKIDQLKDKYESINLREMMKEMIIGDKKFGRGHLYIDTGDTNNREELKTDIGFGARSAASALKMPGKKVVAIRPVEAVWVSPRSYETSATL